MADQPPPYQGGNDKGGYPPMPQPAYPSQPSPYPPPPGGAYPPPSPNYQNTPQMAGGKINPPPPQAGMHQQSTSSTAVVVTQPTVPIVVLFGNFPVRTTCPHCRADVMTAVHYETGTLTWLMCVVLLVLGCWLGCCLIPFCSQPFQDAVHSCPNCRQQIGRWNRM